MPGVSPHARAAAEQLQRGRFGKAIDRATRALRADPTDRHAHGARVLAATALAQASGLGRLRQGTVEQIETAARYGAAAVQQMGRPRAAPEALVFLNYAQVLASLDRHDEARAVATLAAADFRSDAGVCYAMASLAWGWGELAAHRVWSARAFACPDPTGAQQFKRYTHRLSLGDWSAVSELVNAIQCARDPKGYRRIIGPGWDGAPLPGGALLIYRTPGMLEGYGDCLMCAQVLRRVAQRVGRLIVDVPPALTSLYQASFGDLPNLELVTLVSERPTTWPARDRSIEHWSLIPPFYRALDGAPALRADQTAALGPGRHVGICWSATARPSPTGHAHYWRQIPLAAFAPLLELPDVTVHSLQVGPAEQDLAAYPAIQRHRFDSFLDTARVTVALDAVVSVDTSVCHLSAGLGVPTLTLLSTAGDWRWGGEGETTPWYRSMRLVRQARPGAAWDSVVARVCDLIAAGEFPPRLAPPIPLR